MVSSDHDRTVSTIAARVTEFHAQKVPFRLYHGSTNTTRPRHFDPAKIIDTSSLNHVISVDTQAMTCLVEPNVAMDELVDATLPYGVMPPVVMEFPGITVGGGFAGTAGESSGFKYGFFDRIVNWFEMVLPDGQIVKASRHERKDLFFGAAGSFGTLGVATLFELQLVPAKGYVEMTYHPCRGVKESLIKLDAVTKDATNDFVDGIQFSLDKGVIVTGRLIDLADHHHHDIHRFSRRQDPWFYMHVDNATKAMQQTKIVVPLKDYLFRYDRGAFWVGQHAFRAFMTPFNRLTRWALDWFMHTRVMYHALHKSGYSSRFIIQDLLLPRSTAEEFVHHVSREHDIWPLWLCPLKAGEQIPLRPKLLDSTTQTAVETDAEGVTGELAFVNIGVWGPGSTNYGRFIEQNRRLEGKLRGLGGIKWLYAQAFYTEDEFWSIYDRPWYDALREKYNATHLPSVFDKVSIDLGRTRAVTDERSSWVRTLLWRVWPVSAVYGVLSTLLEREYGLAKK